MASELQGLPARRVAVLLHPGADHVPQAAAPQRLLSCGGRRRLSPQPRVAGALSGAALSLLRPRPHQIRCGKEPVIKVGRAQRTEAQYQVKGGRRSGSKHIAFTRCVSTFKEEVSEVKLIITARASFCL